MSTATPQVWEVTIQHQELNKSRQVRGTNHYLVEQKAALQLAVWNNGWKKRQSAERRRQEQELSVRNKADSLALAVRKNEDAERVLHKLANLLPLSLASASHRETHSLWQHLLDQSEFTLPRPAEPKPQPLPEAPQENDVRYQPTLSFLDRKVRSFREQKEQEAKQLFQQDHENWLHNTQHIEQQNQRLATGYADRLTAWEERCLAFASQVEANNQIVAKQQARYQAHEPDAIMDYCDLVLTLLPQPYEAPGKWTLDFVAEHKTLVLDYTLPPANSLPKLKAVTYTAQSDSLNPSYLSSTEQQQLYADLFFQLPLLILHELFRADVGQALTSIVFNGWVTSQPQVCVMSVQADKQHFMSLDLRTQDAKALFAQLSGHFSSPPHAANPVTPLQQVDSSGWTITTIR